MQLVEKRAATSWELDVVERGQPDRQSSFVSDDQRPFAPDTDEMLSLGANPGSRWALKRAWVERLSGLDHPEDELLSAAITAAMTSRDVDKASSLLSQDWDVVLKQIELQHLPTHVTIYLTRSGVVNVRTNMPYDHEELRSDLTTLVSKLFLAS